MEFANFWINTSKVGQYTWIKAQYGQVTVNIKLQKDHLFDRKCNTKRDFWENK